MSDWSHGYSGAGYSSKIHPSLVVIRGPWLGSGAARAAFGFSSGGPDSDYSDSIDGGSPGSSGGVSYDGGTV